MAFAEKTTTAILNQSIDWVKITKKAVFLIREMRCGDENTQIKGTACAVNYFDKRSGNCVFFLVTCSEVVAKTDNQTTLCADRFCSQYPRHQDKHRIHIMANPEHKDFISIPLEKEADFSSLSLPNFTARHGELNLNLEGKISDFRSDCKSYTFTGTLFQTTYWKYSTEKQGHYIYKIDPGGAFDLNIARGSPVVSCKDPGVVIGVVNCSSKKPCLMFFTNSSKQGKR